MNAFVVDKEETARQCITFLKERVLFKILKYSLYSMNHHVCFFHLIQLNLQ